MARGTPRGCSGWPKAALWINLAAVFPWPSFHKFTPELVS